MAVDVTLPFTEILLSAAIVVAALIVRAFETSISSETETVSLMVRFPEAKSFSETTALVLFKTRLTYCLPSVSASPSQTKNVVVPVPVYSIVGVASVSVPFKVSPVI